MCATVLTFSATVLGNSSAEGHIPIVYYSMNMDPARMKVFQGKYMDKGIEGQVYLKRGV